MPTKLAETTLGRFPSPEKVKNTLSNKKLDQGSQTCGPPDAFVRPTNISKILNIIKF
jgi:hypothetical protein